MALSDADRQRRHRERTKQRLVGLAEGYGPNLTPEQVSDRNAVASEPLWPMPQDMARDQMPRFLGWTRYEWSVAPAALVGFFSLNGAWHGWKAEEAEMRRKCMEASARWSEYVARIRAETGRTGEAIRIAKGAPALVRAYEADPTLGGKVKRKPSPPIPAATRPARIPMPPIKSWTP